VRKDKKEEVKDPATEPKIKLKIKVMNIRAYQGTLRI
jgi:hypothetical protein